MTLNGSPTAEPGFRPIATHGASQALYALPFAIIAAISILLA